MRLLFFLGEIGAYLLVILALFSLVVWVLRRVPGPSQVARMAKRHAEVADLEDEADVEKRRKIAIAKLANLNETDMGGAESNTKEPDMKTGREVN